MAKQIKDWWPLGGVVKEEDEGRGAQGRAYCGSDDLCLGICSAAMELGGRIKHGSGGGERVYGKASLVFALAKIIMPCVEQRAIKTYVDKSRLRVGVELCRRDDTKPI